MGKIPFRISLISRSRAADFERELRHPVSERRKLKVFHDNIGKAPIGWHKTFAFHGFHQRIGKLIGAAFVHAHIKTFRRNLFAIGPDAGHMTDLSLAKRDGERDGIAILCRLGLGRGSFAAATMVYGFGKSRGPYHLPPGPHPSIQARYGRPFRCAHEAETVDLAGFAHLRPASQDLLVDGPPEGRPRQPAQRDRRHPKNAAPDRATNCRARSRKNQGRHYVPS